jgi:hypothetical protein
MREGYFKGNKQLLQNVLLFCFSKYGNPENTQLFNLFNTEQT